MDKTSEITNSQDIIDLRDIIARIEYLEDARADWQEENNLPEYSSESDEGWTDEQSEKWMEWDDSEEGEELKALLSLKEQAENCGDWNWGATLISDIYFEEYAKSLAEDIGAVGRDINWPLNHIDWGAAADDLKVDYTSVDFNGETYWVRC